MSTNKRHSISSFAAPTPRGLAAFEQLTPEEKRQLLAAEIEKGLEGTPRKVSAEDIVAAVRARSADARLPAPAIAGLEDIYAAGLKQFGPAQAARCQHELHGRFQLLAKVFSGAIALRAT